MDCYPRREFCSHVQVNGYSSKSLLVNFFSIKTSSVETGKGRCLGKVRLGLNLSFYIFPFFVSRYLSPLSSVVSRLTDPG